MYATNKIFKNEHNNSQWTNKATHNRNNKMIDMLSLLNSYKMNKQSKIYASAQSTGNGERYTFTVRICWLTYIAHVLFEKKYS